MKVIHYRGFHGFKSKCGLEIKKTADGVTVVFTELPDNPGTSVTNFIEHLATLVYTHVLKDCPLESIRWVEHYPATSFREETYDEVTLDWNGQRFVNPRWKRLKTAKVKL